jgi:ElaB/YqjD/DUF883 family membrane-anchored ribosome-binding protein
MFNSILNPTSNGHAARRQESAPRESQPAMTEDGGSFSSIKGAVESAGKAAGQVISDHPAVSIVTAITCGVLIGWWIKRTE